MHLHLCIYIYAYVYNTNTYVHISIFVWSCTFIRTYRGISIPVLGDPARAGPPALAAGDPTDFLAPDLLNFARGRRAAISFGRCEKSTAKVAESWVCCNIMVPSIANVAIGQYTSHIPSDGLCITCCVVTYSLTWVPWASVLPNCAHQPSEGISS